MKMSTQKINTNRTENHHKRTFETRFLTKIIPPSERVRLCTRALGRASRGAPEKWFEKHDFEAKLN